MPAFDSENRRVWEFYVDLCAGRGLFEKAGITPLDFIGLEFADGRGGRRFFRKLCIVDRLREDCLEARRGAN